MKNFDQDYYKNHGTYSIQISPEEGIVELKFETHTSDFGKVKIFYNKRSGASFNVEKNAENFGDYSKIIEKMDKLGFIS